jgi:hypothetical protein
VHHPGETTSTSCSNRSNSPQLSKTNKNRRDKKVQFNQEVVDNELTSKRLIYEKLPMTKSPPKKNPNNNSVIIDIAKLNEAQGFGFNKYLRNEDNLRNNSYTQQIFDSPYFDYRRTHSRVRNDFLMVLCLRCC